MCTLNKHARMPACMQPHVHTHAHTNKRTRAYTQVLVRAVRGLLDSMGPLVVEAETDALNMTRVPPRKDQRLDDYTIEVRARCVNHAVRSVYRAERCVACVWRVNCCVERVPCGALRGVWRVACGALRGRCAARCKGRSGCWARPAHAAVHSMV